MCYLHMVNCNMFRDTLPLDTLLFSACGIIIVSMQCYWQQQITYLVNMCYLL